MTRNRKFTLLVMVVVVMAVAVTPAFAQTSTILVDTDQFIGAINSWLPMALSIMAIGVGIAGAFALAKFVGNMIIGALSGKISR